MPVTVTANGLTISHKGSDGWVRNTTPDVCRTPQTPVPYNIISYSRDLVRGSTSVFADGGNPLSLKGSAYATCTGDEPGVGLGILSNTHRHEATWITYSPNVFVEGRNICRKTDKMFMNNRNCISAAGDYEPPRSVTDRLQRELCRIFCKASQEFDDCKRAAKPGGKPCASPSKRAEENLKNNRKVQNLTRAKYGRGVSAMPERTYLKPPSDITDELAKAARENGERPPRRIYSAEELQSRMRSRLNRILKRKGIQKAAKIGARAWTKLVPGLNVLSTIYDVGSTAYDAYQIYDEYKTFTNRAMQQAIEVKPDLTIQDANGNVRDVYDFKFPGDRYRNQQFEEFTELNGGREPTTIDDDLCQCRGPQVAS